MSKGLTLIEVLIAAVIIGILGIGILSLQVILGENQNIVLNSFINVEENNSNISEIIRFLRIANTAEDGSYPLAVVDDNEIIFFSDYDFDNETERLRYTLNNETLERGIIEPTGQPPSYPVSQEIVKTLSTNVKNENEPVFYYYNGDWPEDTINNPLPQANRLSQTRTIRVYLLINDNENNQRSDYKLDSFVNLRLLKDNI